MTHRMQQEKLSAAYAEIRLLNRTLVFLAREVDRLRLQNEPEPRAWQRAEESGEPQELPDGSWTSWWR